MGRLLFCVLPPSNPEAHPRARAACRWFDPGYGYHVDDTKGVPTGNEPESIYAVMSGTHYNGHCCFVRPPHPPPPSSLPKRG